MMRLLSIALVSVFAGLIALAQSEETPILPDCQYDREAMLAMDYWTFDQDPEQGVRSIAGRPGCELVAADLIRDYHALLRERGEPVTVEYEDREFTMSETGEMTILYWHEGQIRASEGQTKQAIQLFKLSLKPAERNFGAWNEYALASIAFLENDREELLFQRSLMAESEPADSINLGAVDGLIACFGQTYSEAYGSKACNRRPGWDTAAEEE